MTEASEQVLRILRSTDNMQWYVVPLLVFVIYVYVVEVGRRNWSAVLLGIALWAAELTWEMFNALILHFTQYAPLWCTPGGNSAFVIYAGLNIEIEFFFAVGGLMVVKSLPEDKNMRIAGIPNRILIPMGFGLTAVLVEVLLNRSGLLIWAYPWWNWPHIWLIILGYCLPWLGLAWCHDHLSLAAKKRMALLLVLSAVILHILFVNVLGWI